MASISASAADVLPAELLKEVQKYWRGGLLWIPNIDFQEKKENNDRALLLIRAGLSAADVAESCNMKLGHVYFIARKLPDNPYSRKR